MVCPRCVDVVREIFIQNQSKNLSVELGKVDFFYEGNFSFDKLNEDLIERGFEIVESENEIITEKIKLTIIKLVFYDKINENFKNSAWLENELKIPYQKLSKAFAEVTNTTIEKYLILQKIERVKELVTYNKMNLKEIAHSLGYKHLSHLSNQFKTIEGLSLSEYKKTNMNDRKFLDDIL